jgi:23S rRNA (uracil1939-C5)-methyltransferase
VPFEHVLDVFSGTGNLSDPVIAEKLVPQRMVDLSNVSHSDFMAMNLYDDDALPLFLQRQSLKKFDLMMVNPPRRSTSIYIRASCNKAAAKPGTDHNFSGFRF